MSAEEKEKISEKIKGGMTLDEIIDIVMEYSPREFLSWLQEEKKIDMYTWRVLDEYLDEWLAQP